MKRSVTFIEESARRPVEPSVTTKYGRTVKELVHFGQEMGYVVVLTEAEEIFTVNCKNSKSCHYNHPMKNMELQQKKTILWR